jgi:GxxExxY protein
VSLELEDQTGRIIGAAIEVHRTLGPGFLEAVYENALAVELSRRGIPFVRQLGVSIRYQSIEVGEHVLDLLVEDQVVVELKATRRFEDIHFVIVKSYLKALGREVGLLLNFASTALEVKRITARPLTDASPVPGFLDSRVHFPG